MIWALILAFLFALASALPVEQDAAPVILTEDGNQIVTKSGQTLTLTCLGKQPIHWNYANEEDAEIDSYFVPSSVLPHGSNLTLQAHFEDTGFYTCLDSNNRSAHVYVYVQDETHLLTQSQPYNFRLATQHQSVTIPCKPTSPDVHISLVLNSEEEISPESSLVKYDPQVGFTITDAQVALHTGLYDCIATRGSKVETSLWEIMILRQLKSPPKPHITSSVDSLAVQGQNFTLTCTVTMDMGDIFTLEWAIPTEDGITVGDPKLEKKTVAKNACVQATRVLSITNASMANSGSYTCTLTTHMQEKNSATQIIHVISKEFEVDDNITV